MHGRMRTARLVTLSLFIAVAASAQVTEIASPAGAGAAEAFVFATNDALFLSWLEPVANSDRFALRFARFSGGKWSAPRTIVERNDFFVNWADFPSIVVDAKGVLYTHWLQKSSKGVYSYDVYFAVSSDGGRTWAKPSLLNRDGKKNEHGFTSLAPLPGGGIGAVWLDGRNMVEGKEEGDMTLRYATIDARGVIRSEVQLDDRTCECCTTDMTMSSAGPVVVYRDRSADELRDIAVVRRTAKGWTKPRMLHDDGWKIAGCPVNGPQIASSGRSVASAWFTAANEKARVFVAFSSDGGATFAAPVQIDGGKPAGRVDVVMLDADTAVVTWLEQTATGAEIRARRVQRNRTAAPAIKVADSATARAAGFPRMAAIGRDVYFAWTRQGESGKGVRIARVRF